MAHGVEEIELIGFKMREHACMHADLTDRRTAPHFPEDDGGGTENFHGDVRRGRQHFLMGPADKFKAADGNGNAAGFHAVGPQAGPDGLAQAQENTVCLQRVGHVAGNRRRIPVSFIVRCIGDEHRCIVSVREIPHHFPIGLKMRGQNERICIGQLADRTDAEQVQLLLIGTPDEKEFFDRQRPELLGNFFGK